MLEKLLMPFASEDTKLVIAAMEKAYGRDDTSIQMESNIIDLYNMAMEGSSKFQCVLLRVVRRRLVTAHRHRYRLTKARILAGQILMGETETPTPAQHTQVAQQQQTALIQAALQNQQAQAFGTQQVNNLGLNDANSMRGF